MPMPLTATPAQPAATPETAQERAALRKVSQALEANFLAEMLKSAGLAEGRQAFGGGAGEAQFSTFLTREYADALAGTGGLGLSESIYRSLLARAGLEE